MKFRVHQRGQTILEYALLIALLAVVAIVILRVLGNGVKDVYVTVNDAMITSSGDSVASPPEEEPDNPYQGQIDFANGWYKALRNQGPIPGTNQYYGTDLGHNIASGAALGRLQQQMMQGGASPAEILAANAAVGQYLEATYN